MNSNQNFNVDLNDKDQILSTIAKEISAIQKEHSLSLDALRKNLVSYDYEGLTLNHYNPKILKLKNELSLLKAKLNEKENNQAKKISYLIDEFNINFEEISLQINLTMNSIKLKYEILKENHFQSIDEIEKILEEVNNLKNQFKNSWFKNLNKISDNLSLVISRANHRVLKKITPYVEAIFSDSIMSDILSNDIIIKKYIANCNEKLITQYKELENLSIYLNEMKATNIVYEQELATTTKNETLDNIDNPPFVTTIAANEEINNKLSNEIQDIKNIIENELTEIQRANLERENKWQIFLENERAKHKELLEQIRLDYHNSLLNEQRNMINQINNAIDEQSQQIINKELSVDHTDLDEIYDKISKEHQEIFNENIKNKQNLLEKEIANLNYNVESRINNKLEELNAEQESLLNKKNSYLEELKNKINLIRKATIKNNIENSVFDNNLVNKINLIQKEIKENPYTSAINFKNYSSPFLSEKEKLEIKDQIKNSPNQDLINSLTNEITDRILSKFNSEVEKIRLQNKFINNNFDSLNSELYANATLPQTPMMMPPLFDPQYLNNQFLWQDPQIPLNDEMINNLNNFSNLDSQNHEQDKVENPSEVKMVRKVKFVGSDDKHHGRLSSEDIRKYANSIISINRKKILKSNS